VPSELVVEEDVVWDFDALLQELTQDFNAEREREG